MARVVNGCAAVACDESYYATWTRILEDGQPRNAPQLHVCRAHYDLCEQVAL